MSIVKFEPVKEMARLRDEMDRLFNRVLGETSPLTTELWRPAMDVREENNLVIVTADIPGVAKQDVSITATDTSLTIDGSKEEVKEYQHDGYSRRERSTGKFLRTIPLPARVDAAKAVATFVNGTVTITMPKLSEGTHGHKIKLD